MGYCIDFSEIPEELNESYEDGMHEDQDQSLPGSNRFGDFNAQVRRVKEFGMQKGYVPT